jgi:hypothetical protein
MVTMRERGLAALKDAASATWSQRDKRSARKRLRDLHARLGSGNTGERESALRKIDERLRKQGKTWNDVPDLLYDETRASASRADPRDADASERVGTNLTVLDVVHAF